MLLTLQVTFSEVYESLYTLFLLFDVCNIETRSFPLFVFHRTEECKGYL